MPSLLQAEGGDKRQVNGLARARFADECLPIGAKTLRLRGVHLIRAVAEFHFAQVHDAVITVYYKIDLRPMTPVLPRNPPDPAGGSIPC